MSTMNPGDLKWKDKASGHVAQLCRLILEVTEPHIAYGLLFYATSIFIFVYGFEDTVELYSHRKFFPKDRANNTNVCNQRHE